MAKTTPVLFMTMQSLVVEVGSPNQGRVNPNSRLEHLVLLTCDKVARMVDKVARIVGKVARTVNKVARIVDKVARTVNKVARRQARKGLRRIMSLTLKESQLCPGKRERGGCEAHIVSASLQTRNWTLPPQNVLVVIVQFYNT